MSTEEPRCKWPLCAPAGRCETSCAAERDAALASTPKVGEDQREPLLDEPRDVISAALIVGMAMWKSSHELADMALRDLRSHGWELVRTDALNDEIVYALHRRCTEWHHFPSERESWPCIVAADDVLQRARAAVVEGRTEREQG